jgi:hypothetical protein
VQYTSARVVDDCSRCKSKVPDMANDRDLFVMAQSCSLLSGTILSPPMLARLLIGSETVVSALHEC